LSVAAAASDALGGACGVAVWASVAVVPVTGVPVAVVPAAACGVAADGATDDGVAAGGVATDASAVLGAAADGAAAGSDSSNTGSLGKRRLGAGRAFLRIGFLGRAFLVGPSLSTSAAAALSERFLGMPDSPPSSSAGSRRSPWADRRASTIMRSASSRAVMCVLTFSKPISRKSFAISGPRIPNSLASSKTRTFFKSRLLLSRDRSYGRSSLVGSVL
jgi:hypothetical protein